MKKKKEIYFVRMENNEYCDFKVLASSKKEAERIATEESHLARSDGSNFETGEISKTQLSAFDDGENPTEENPVVVCD